MNGSAPGNRLARASVHSELGQNIQIRRERLEKEEDGDSGHRERPRRDFPSDLANVSDDFDHQQDQGGDGRHQEQRDERAEPGVRPIESPEQITCTPHEQQDEHLGQRRNDDSEDSQLTRLVTGPVSCDLTILPAPRA